MYFNRCRGTGKEQSDYLTAWLDPSCQLQSGVELEIIAHMGKRLARVIEFRQPIQQCRLLSQYSNLQADAINVGSECVDGCAEPRFVALDRSLREGNCDPALVASTVHHEHQGRED